MTTRGDDAPGALFNTFQDGADRAEIVAIGYDFSANTSGDRSPGVVIGDPSGARANIIGSSFQMTVESANVTTSGADSTGFFFSPWTAGAVDSIFAAVFDDINVATSGVNSHGIVLGQDLGADGLVNTEIVLTGGKFVSTTSGVDSIGLSLGGVGTLDGQPRSYAFQNVNVATTGDEAVGVLVGGVGALLNGATSSIILEDFTVSTSGTLAHGMVLGAGLGRVPDAGDPNNDIVLRNIASTTTGEGAAALVIGGNSDVAPTASTFTASGTDAHGVLVELEADQTSRFTVTGDTVVTAEGSGGSGILVNGPDAGEDDDGGPDAAFASLAIAAPPGGAAAEIVIAAGGIVTGANNAIRFDGAAGDVILAGSITGESGTAVHFADTDDRFELQVGGEADGLVAANGGADLFALGGTGEASFDFALIGDQFTGFESFEKVGASTWTLTGSSDVNGPMTVREGTLLVNGALGGLDTTVLAGTVLGGTGTLGAVTVTGGTLAPGNSIGTLTTGNLSLDAASTLAIEVSDNGSADHVIVNGSVALGGSTLAVTEVDGSNFAGTNAYSYTIITNDAADPVNGVFGAIVNDLAFLDAAIDYAGGDGNEVVLALGQTRMFPDVAVTFNQRQASSGLAAFDRTAGSDADTVFTELLVANMDQALAAFDATSGEIYAGLIAGSTDGDGNAAEFDQGQYGFDLGIDYRGADNRWAVGLATGYLDGRLDVDARRSYAKYDAWHVGGYARFGTGNAGLTASGTVSYARFEANVRREITVGTLSRTARAAVDLDGFTFGGELRYGLSLGGNWAAGPIVSAVSSEADLGKFAESGANSLDLAGRDASDSLSRYGGGAFLNWTGERGVIDASVQYVDAGSGVASAGLAFAGAPSAPFTVRSPRAGGEAALVGLAGRIDLGSNWSLGASVRALVGGASDDLHGAVTLGWRF